MSSLLNLECSTHIHINIQNGSALHLNLKCSSHRNIKIHQFQKGNALAELHGEI